jgi:hypothetical protein
VGRRTGLADDTGFHGRGSYRWATLPESAGRARGGDGSIWFYSGVREPYALGAVQTFDDRGTLALADDAWQVLPYSHPSDQNEVVTAFERTAGDTWYAYCIASRAYGCFEAVRYHGGQKIEYPIPGEVDDIFGLDIRHVWFVTTASYPNTRVFSLDDGGTPADMSDDVWNGIPPIAGMSGKPSVAVDAMGRLWLGDASGLYRYDGASWQLVYGKRPICDLAPAADGTLYAQVDDDSPTACAAHSDLVIVARADGTIDDSLYSIKHFIEEEPATVRTAWRRNSLWAIASVGAIWYISHQDPGQELQRRSGSGLSTYALPVKPEAVQRLEVDARGHVWLVADSQLWRMEGPRPIYLYLPMVSR